MAISTAVKGVAPFQNLIVNGIVLAEDGSKMSKSKQNYPSPLKVADEHGADACRLYLCNSPVVRAEPLKFQKDGVKDIVKDIFLPYFNAYRFLIQNITRYEKRSGTNFVFDDQMRVTVSKSESANYMDKWIVAANQNLIKQCRNELDNYRLYTVVREILGFLENLTNWYVRLNRPRMKGDEGITEEDQRTSLNTLFDCLINTTQLLAPICPFLSEYVF
jgi:isoleucyl-tRNA synthetase